jgi:hypothetical protein
MRKSAVPAFATVAGVQVRLWLRKFKRFNIINKQAHEIFVGLFIGNNTEIKRISG